jgi:hypothetical protein
MSAPTGRSRKRARTPSPTPLAPPKRSRTTPGEALMSVSHTLAKFSNSITTALAPPPSALATTPARRSKAVTTALAQEKWLSSSQMVSLIDYLRADPTAFDIYVILEDADLRQEWVRKQLGL